MNSGHYGFPNILGLLRATAFKAIGKPGASAGAALAGGTTSGAPTSGQFDVGDAVIDQTGTVWICTAAGSPGTWTQVASGTSSGNMNWRSTWSSSVSYAINDVVRYSGGSYVATVANSNVIPAVTGDGTRHTALAAQTPTSSNNGSNELGTKFSADAAGFCYGIRFYKNGSETGTSRTLRLWDTTTSTVVASCVTSGETGSGWQEGTLATPYLLVANRSYIASYTDNSWFPKDGLSLPLDNAPLHIPSGGGLYNTAGNMPANNLSTFYWIDVVFEYPGTGTTWSILSNS